MDFNWSMRMSPIFSENVCFVQPFDGMWPKPPTFSHNAEKCTEIDKCECGQYLAKTYALCNHFTAFFAERRKMDWDRSCERVQYLAETYALCNHFTACGPNLRLFRRKAKNGLKLIYPNESCTLPKPMLCPTIWRHEAQLQTFSQNAEKWTEIDQCEWDQYLAKTYALCNHFTACGPNLRLFRRKAKNGLKLIYPNESCTLPKPMLCPTIWRHEAQLQTFSQNAEKWTEIDQCEWDQYLAKTYALRNHFTVCGPNLRLFRRMEKTGLKSIYANESYILPKPMLCATILRHVAQTKDSFAERRKMEFNWSLIFSRNVYLVQPFYGM